MHVCFLNIGGGEFFVILILVLLLFGGKGNPQFARTLGKSIREFKNAADDLKHELHKEGGDVIEQVQKQIDDIRKPDPENR